MVLAPAERLGSRRIKFGSCVKPWRAIGSALLVPLNAARADLSPIVAERSRLVEEIAGRDRAYAAEIAEFRKSLKIQGKTTAEVLSASERFLKEKGWLK